LHPETVAPCDFESGLISCTLNQVGDAELDQYRGLVNRLLMQKGKSPLAREVLAIGINQLKVL